MFFCLFEDVIYPAVLIVFFFNVFIVFVCEVGYAVVWR